MIKIVDLSTIKSILPKVDLINEIEKGFVAYSNGEVVVPPVGELSFDSPPGDVHIKYGYIKNDDIYVIKIASGFYNNSVFDLPTGNGMIIVFDQKNGQPIAILNDECYLTDVRTAVAGAICAKYFAPKNINRIGIVGTGVQARMQLQYLKGVVDCNDVLVWGRNSDSLDKYEKDMERSGFAISTTINLDEVTNDCQLIVTCTPSETPLINSVNKGTHVTAMGSDTVQKQELHSNILYKADLVISDSRSQSADRGEIHHALKDNLDMNSVVELGEVISNKRNGRRSDRQITIADLTGVAVQDIQIAKAVLSHL